MQRPASSASLPRRGPGPGRPAGGLPVRRRRPLRRHPRRGEARCSSPPRAAAAAVAPRQGLLRRLLCRCHKWHCCLLGLSCRPGGRGRRRSLLHHQHRPQHRGLNRLGRCRLPSHCLGRCRLRGHRLRSLRRRRQSRRLGIHRLSLLRLGRCCRPKDCPYLHRGRRLLGLPHPSRQHWGHYPDRRHQGRRHRNPYCRPSLQHLRLRPCRCPCNRPCNHHLRLRPCRCPCHRPCTHPSPSHLLPWHLPHQRPSRLP